MKEFGGHGIGREMHMDPYLPNEGKPHRGPLLNEGSVLAIEPMLTLGSPWTVQFSDNWTTITTTTLRGALGAHRRCNARRAPDPHCARSLNTHFMQDLRHLAANG
ncbi:MAG: M24 family metallopeptidase [Lawsonella clevelandensis]